MSVADGALERRKLKCPRCGRVAFVDASAGGLGTRCPSCGGVHLPANDVEHVLCYELGLDVSELRARARPPADGEVPAYCSFCDAALWLVELERVDVDLCVRCGAGWLDFGELERLTYGRHLERAPPSELARAFLPKALTPGKERDRVVVAPPRSRSGLVRFGVSALGGAGLAYLMGGVPLILFSAVFVAVPLLLGLTLATTRWRRRVVVDRKRGVLHALNLGVPREHRTVRIEDVKAIAVEPIFATGPRPQLVAWQVVPRFEDERAARWFTSTDRVLIHRLAFQLSQVLEVPVETPPDESA